MDDISNRTLALLLITAIVISLGTSVYTMNNLTKKGLLTGRATSQQGNVTLTVTSTVSILLTTSIVDFGTGFVNTSNCANNATLNAGQSYNDTENVDCWTGTSSPTSLILENDGNRNATVRVFAENESAFFNGYAGSNPFNFSFRARNHESATCASGLQSTYTNFGGTNRTVCADMLYQPTTDVLGIDIRVTIPADLASGTYENSTIEFTAVQS